MTSRVRRYQVRKKPGNPNNKEHWSDVQKLEAVSLWLMLGNLVMVSDSTGIPHLTLKKWRMKPWWNELEEEIRRAKRLQTTDKMAKVREKATSIVMDRLDNGDLFYDSKTSTFKRKPVNAKTASEIMVKALDREMLLEKLDEPQEDEQSIMERLNTIADKLLQASGKTRKVEVIDVKPVQEDSKLLS